MSDGPLIADGPLHQQAFEAENRKATAHIDSGVLEVQNDFQNNGLAVLEERLRGSRTLIWYRGCFNAVLHIMPPQGTDAERKRYCALKIAHFGQSLKRRGREHVGVTTYEKKLGVDLHAHHVCRLEPKDKDLLAQCCDAYVMKAKMFPASERNRVVGYCTKQRRPFSPEFEKNTPHRREKGGLPIRGPRVSYTKAAAALLAEIQTTQLVKRSQNNGLAEKDTDDNVSNPPPPARPAMDGGGPELRTDA